MSRDPLDPQRTDLRRRLPNDIATMDAPPSRPAFNPNRVLENSTMFGPSRPYQEPVQTDGRPLPDVIGGARRALNSAVNTARDISYQSRYRTPGQDMAGPGIEMSASEDQLAQRLARAGGPDARVVYAGKDARGNSVYSDTAFGGAEAQVRGALGTRADRAFDPNGANGYGAPTTARQTLEDLRGQQRAFDSMAPQVQARENAALAELMSRRVNAQTARTESEAVRNAAQASRDEQLMRTESARAELALDDVPREKVRRNDAQSDADRVFGMDRVDALVEGMGENADAVARQQGFNNARDLAILQAFNALANEMPEGDQRLANSALFREAQRVRSDLLRRVNNEQGRLGWGTLMPWNAATEGVRGWLTGQERNLPWDRRNELQPGIVPESAYRIDSRGGELAGRQQTLVVGDRATRISPDDPANRILLETLANARRFRQQE